MGIVLLPLCIVAILAGLIEALYYGVRGAESFARNEHIDLVVFRFFAFVLPLAGFLFAGRPFWLLATEEVAAAFFFPMLHDEAYNFTRLWLKESALLKSNPVRLAALKAFTGWRTDMATARVAWRIYKYGYQSPTTTATNDFSGVTRTWLAFVGLSVWLVGWLYYWLR